MKLTLFFWDVWKQLSISTQQQETPFINVTYNWMVT